MADEPEDPPEGGEQEELFPQGSLTGGKTTLKTLVKTGQGHKLRVALSRMEVPLRGGLPDPDRQVRALVTREETLAERDDPGNPLKVTGWKTTAKLRVEVRRAHPGRRRRPDRAAIQGDAGSRRRIGGWPTRTLAVDGDRATVDRLSRSEPVCGPLVLDRARGPRRAAGAADVREAGRFGVCSGTSLERAAPRLCKAGAPMSSRRGRDADMAENTPSDGSVAEQRVLADAYVRHQGPTTTQRVFETAGDHAGWCVVCDEQIAPDESVTLIPIGCADPEDQAKMRAGRFVSARALIVHAACAGR
jgi:hypothetical protein